MVKIRLAHIVLRPRERADGLIEIRPRYVPSPRLRAAGEKGEDLRHPSGAWFTTAECAAWIEARLAHIAARASAKAAGKRPPPHPARRAVFTFGELVEGFLLSPRIARAGIDINAVAPRTAKDYAAKLQSLERFRPALWTEEAAALTPDLAYALYERLWHAKGLDMANGIMRVVSAAYSWAMRSGKVRANPCRSLGMKQTKPRLRCGSIAEMRALVAAADLLGRHDMGDCIAMGLWTGQRQGDRLKLVDAGLVNGRRLFRQAKRGAVVEVREAPELAARLAAAAARRAGWRVVPVNVLVNEATRQPWNEHSYRHEFAAVRAAAAAGIRDSAGGWALKPMPSLADFRDQDLRDTAVTWLGLAGATPIEIAAITGHSVESVTRVLKHYLSIHPDMGDSAIAKMLAWHGEKEKVK